MSSAESEQNKSPHENDETGLTDRGPMPGGAPGPDVSMTVALDTAGVEMDDVGEVVVNGVKFRREPAASVSSAPALSSLRDRLYALERQLDEWQNARPASYAPTQLHSAMVLLALSLAEVCRDALNYEESDTVKELRKRLQLEPVWLSDIQSMLDALDAMGVPEAPTHLTGTTTDVSNHPLIWRLSWLQSHVIQLRTAVERWFYLYPRLVHIEAAARMLVNWGGDENKRALATALNSTRVHGMPGGVGFKVEVELDVDAITTIGEYAAEQGISHAEAVKGLIGHGLNRERHGLIEALVGVAERHHGVDAIAEAKTLDVTARRDEDGSWYAEVGPTDQSFLEALFELYDRFEVSIGHEDTEGAFIIRPWRGVDTVRMAEARQEEAP